MSDYISSARERTLAKYQELQSRLVDARESLGNKGCVFATGSFGRLEAGNDSDLDLFVVVKTYEKEIGGKPKVLFRLKDTEQIRLKNDIIVAAEASNIKEFDAGGKYLETHKFSDFTLHLGSREDDYLNTFTGRLLLLLESRSLIGDVSYEGILKDVIAEYFKDYAGNENSFVPAFLCNDILRMWRTFCVNYEYFRKDGGGDFRIKNLKLKYIRIVTCFSAIVYLLANFTLAGTVTPEVVRKMVSLTPTERIAAIGTEEFKSLQNWPEIAEILDEVLSEYSAFLELNHLKKDEAIKSFEADERQWRMRSYAFGRKFANAMERIAGDHGFDNQLYRVTSV